VVMGLLPHLRSTVCSLQTDSVIHYLPVLIDGTDLSRSCQCVK
jgi:hypothetical protein